jgi:hypothetical protein
LIRLNGDEKKVEKYLMRSNDWMWDWARLLRMGQVKEVITKLKSGGRRCFQRVAGSEIISHVHEELPSPSSLLTKLNGHFFRIGPWVTPLSEWIMDRKRWKFTILSSGG